MEIALLVISISIIALVLFQSNKASDAGQILNSANDRLFGVVKERGMELFITRLTACLGVLFMVTSFILYIK